MQISRALDEIRKPNAEPGAQAGRDLAALIALDRSAQAAQREFSTVVDQLVQTATIGEKRRLPVVGFQLRRGLDDLDVRAKDLDPKLRALFIEQVGHVRTLALGSDAILAVRGQELDLIGNAEKLIAENSDLSARLTKAVDQLVWEAETEVSSSARGALSVQQLSARVLLVFAALSLVSSILIVWLYVGRNLIRRLTHLSSGMLAIAGGRLHSPIDISGRDEVAEMGRVVEIFRRNTLERDELLAERAQAADRLEQQVRGAHGRAGAIGRGTARARRGQPGGEFDRRPRDRAHHHRRQGDAAFQHRGRRDLCVRRSRPGIPAARDLRTGRYDRRGDQGSSNSHGRDGDRRSCRAANADADSGRSERSVIAGLRRHSPRRFPRPAHRAAARCRPHRRRAGGPAPAAGRVSQEHGRPAADLRRAVSAGDPECAPVRRDPGQEPAARAGQPAQVAIPRQHEPRAAHPAQRHHRADRDDGHQRGALRHREGAGAAQPRAPRRHPPARPHQPGARPLEDRGRQARAQPAVRQSGAAGRRGDRHRAPARRAEQQPPDRAVPGRPGADRRRPDAAAADPAQPAEQCLQVHQAGRGRAAGEAGAPTAATGSSLPSPTPASA